MLGFADGRGRVPLVETGAPVIPRRSAGARRAGLDRPDLAPGSRERRGLKAALDGVGGLGWSVIGFVGGAVFWHFIGFWGFVSEVVLAGGARPMAETPAIHVSVPTVRAGIMQIANASSAQDCTRLSLDRRTGVTSAHPCEADHPPLPSDAFQGRQDRMSGATRRP